MTTLSHCETITHKYGMLPEEVFGYEPRVAEECGHPLPTKATVHFEADRGNAHAVYEHELDEAGRLLRVIQDGRLLLKRTWHDDEAFTEVLPNGLERSLVRVEDDEWLLAYARGDAARISKFVDPEQPTKIATYCEYQDYEGNPDHLHITHSDAGMQQWEGVFASTYDWKKGSHPIAQTHFQYNNRLLARTVTVGTYNQASSCTVRFERIAGRLINVVSEAIPNWRTEPLVQQQREYDRSGRVEKIQTAKVDADGDDAIQYVELSYD